VSSHVALGHVYDNRAEFDKSIRQYKAAIELEPDWGAPHAWLAGIYYQIDQADSMQAEIGKAEDLAAEDDITWNALGHIHFALRHFSEAETHLLKAIELSPETATYRIDLAYLYLTQKGFESALQAIDTAAQLREDEYAYAHQARASVYIEQQRLDQALDELSRALELDPENSRIHSSLSFVYLQQGRTAEAQQAAEEAIRLNRYTAGGHEDLAFALYAQEQIDEALEAAQEAVRLSPKLDTAHYILGLCYLGQGEEAKAAEAFETFLGLYWDTAYSREYKSQAEAYLAQLK
jgi:tetratricopeptide (TPR) repeat protein